MIRRVKKDAASLLAKLWGSEWLCLVYRKTQLFFSSSCHEITANSSSVWTNSLKALSKYTQVSHLHSSENSRPLKHLPHRSISLTDKNSDIQGWGVSIFYANLRSAHQPLIRDLWKQLTFSWSSLPFFSQNTQPKENFNFNATILVFLPIVFDKGLMETLQDS